MSSLPVVLVFASRPLRLQSTPAPLPGETNELDCRCYSSDENLEAIIAQERPDVIVSFGNRRDYPHLQSAPQHTRDRWLHFESPVTAADLESAGSMVFCFFLHRVLGGKDESVGRLPLVSVFTPTFRTGERAHRAYRSLQQQTYEHWEWVVVDDSDDDGATFRTLKDIALGDARVSISTSHRRSGKIGEVKRRACALARGAILVELDHDDQLTTNALADIVQAFAENADVGFVYSDWALVAEDSGMPLTYGDRWAFGYGSYRSENYQGQQLIVAEAPPLNAETIRHIVGVPNHVRAWRKDVYWQIGGHNPDLHVADDYELLLRTFLHTRMLHVPKLCYIQYLKDGSNAQDVRRSEIQRLVRCLKEHYDGQIHKRLEEFNLADPLWT
jgi:O-antigen biosynthesis protein